MTDTARALAVKCLVDCDMGAFSNLSFKQRTERTGLGSQEISFAAAIFYGTLERLITLDWILAHFVGSKKLDREVRAILRSGLYQILYLDSVPAHAAVNESVSLCRVFKKSSASSLVNAVLRKARNFDLGLIGKIEDESERDSVKYSLCPEIVSLIKGEYPDDADRIMNGYFEHKTQYIRVNTLKMTADEAITALAAENITVQKTELDGCLEVTKGNVIGTKPFKNGAVRIQSLAAQTAVKALDPQKGDTVVDLCSAPGGKALTAAQLMSAQGKIYACDISESRLSLVASSSASEGALCIETKVFDASADIAFVQADRVLCDVPCSNLGEISSKPELRLRKPDGKLSEKQLEILKGGSNV